jgi:pimeloyl-ACP methyl ester carboxylesterase
MWRWPLAAAAAAVACAPAAHAALALKPCEVKGVSARCGTFVVPENRASPDGRTIALHVLVVPAVHKPALSDAFTYLIGGPGGAATQAVDWVLPTFGALNDRRDILLVDQRGTGSSHPLSCAMPAHMLKTASQKRAYATSCFRSVHADVTQYGTRAAMDDLDAVRAALGYRQLDIYGASYGATAAQVFLKRHPSSVRTIALDGATAIDVPFFSRFAAGAQAALDDVARRCSADAACNRAFPHWRTQFSTLVRAWDRKPVANRRGQTTTGAGLAGVVQSMLVDASTAAAIPLLVSRAARGDYRTLNAHIQPGPGSLDLMFYSIWCSEPWVGLGAHAPWHTDFDSYATSSIAYHRDICKWIPKRAEPANAWTLPHSSTPLLLLAGGADPQDPIANFPGLKRAFPNSRAIIVPHYGHTVAQFGCLSGLVSRFVIDRGAKRLDTRCVRAITAPSFALR